MPVDEDDRRLGNVRLMDEATLLDQTSPSKRRCMQFRTRIPAQTEPTQVTNADDKMGVHIFDSRDRMEGTQDFDTFDTDTAAEVNEGEETPFHASDTNQAKRRSTSSMTIQQKTGLMEADEDDEPGPYIFDSSMAMDTDDSTLTATSVLQTSKPSTIKEKRFRGKGAKKNTLNQLSHGGDTTDSIKWGHRGKTSNSKGPHPHEL